LLDDTKKGTREMNYLSVCSGIEAATVAWHHMGWNPVGFSEIEKFPSQVLAHHYPQVTNFGDMTKYKEWKLDDSVGLLVGGTPCQSFSVAGLRKGLEDPRGNLALTYVGILDKFRPKWFVWENVPGVLSSNGGRDFGSFLGALVELGYGFAYRVLDAQNFGVAQRRRRVFVVGCLGSWESAAKVLFESESLSGDIKKGRNTAKETTTFVESSFGTFRQDPIGGTTKASGGVLGGGSETLVYENHGTDSRVKEISISPTVTARWGTGGNNVPLSMQRNLIDCDKGQTTVLQPVAYSFDSLASNSMKSSNPHSGCREVNLAKTLDTTTPEPSKNQGGIGIIQQRAVLQPAYGIPSNCNVPLAQSYCIQGGGTTSKSANGSGYKEEQSFTLNVIDVHGVATFVDTYNGTIQNGVSATITADVAGPTHSGPKIMQNMAVRKLTPVECERLQGFPDNYTNIKENCPDGPRYKALGNSMAVPVMKWIGKRINLINKAQEK
jgi:DNA (cytosine-5)-methyltransferase 1